MNGAGHGITVRSSPASDILEYLAIATEDQEYFLTRLALSSLFGLILFVAQSAAACAQAVPVVWPVEWTLKLEYLFGTQRIREATTANFLVWPNPVTVDYSPGFWLVTGQSEVSLSPRVSVRVSGSTNIPYSDQDVVRLAVAPQGGMSLGGVWPANTTFVSLEATGAYHFLDDGLYRLSVAAGYRYEWWNRAGEIGNQVLKDTLASSIPFLGLQAGLSLPAWRSRFEVIGSAFMNSSVSCRASQGVSFSSYAFNASRGGRVEVRLCGEASVTTRLVWGITGKYTFEALYGPVSGVINGIGQETYNGYLEQSIGQVGLYLTWIM